ncbi:MAG: (d)CMP kinase [Crocinitomicaceae bacterium]|nr:(d)CMP kinase [Crocinitomicaceae bacterium]
MNTSKITIAIDGYSSCGKSTLAKDLAKELAYIFIDSGAMYRGVSYFSIQSGFVKDGIIQADKVISQLDEISLRFVLNDIELPELHLNDVNVAEEIRSPEVSGIVSKIAAIKEVREKLVREQQLMGKNGGIVMDGRDIGSVVFPKAELKLFVTADIETRAERRYKELTEKGISISKEDVKINLAERDHLDSTREIAPLRRVEDAIIIDNTELDRDEQLQLALSYAKDILAVI